MVVVSEARDGARRRWRLNELLPDAFGPDDLAARDAVGSGNGSTAEDIPEGRG
jgi:hypothetical protein